MLSYLDKTFCCSKVEVHTCGREYTPEIEQAAIEAGLPVSLGQFCNQE